MRFDAQRTRALKEENNLKNPQKYFIVILSFSIMETKNFTRKLSSIKTYPF